MIARTLPRALTSTRLVRTYAVAKDSTAQPPQDPEKARQEAAQLAVQSLKDMGSLFSMSSSDETQPIDTAPIFKDPKLFGPLSLLHQGQVLKELQDKYDKKWTKLTLEDKYLGYYIAYGDWGVREDFKNWNTLEAPYDLPFKVPSHIKTTTPTKDTKILKLKDPVVLAETPVRLKQFDVKKMDGVTKFFIFLTVLITLFAVARDKRIGEEGRPVEVVIVDKHELERTRKRELAEQQEREAEQKQAQSKKWYYLWLK
ncbi:uncharacterized protein CANTADRAFT_50980 [Suhomyces tanzawaensis NRRL Y-17324]|uniref:Genetic interactor of prohibitin 7, mitochondrial n=1 Tax=Suhomyces tanzawaensis NRRL Y-17324 TaxID=984487 RepID=A0A1E4SHX6_9ASCO|nr:uncharacterized protein CANTADRAFT_50980 [Suhomyces tanzawaensis NRRL Y-17324]ODV79119.1 hypothetical protein CANTADRAFT_50980 [Suhomyces tanzawaensis NRRL Y-17324]